MAKWAPQPDAAGAAGLRVDQAIKWGCPRGVVEPLRAQFAKEEAKRREAQPLGQRLGAARARLWRATL
eukprot:10473074-Lingulodinium_polyedra.AAC.1